MKGDKIKVRVKRLNGIINSQISEHIDVEVVEEHPKFVVLNNGKFNFCAFRNDLKKKEAIVI